MSDCARPNCPKICRNLASGSGAFGPAEEAAEGAAAVDSSAALRSCAGVDCCGDGDGDDGGDGELKPKETVVTFAGPPADSVTCTLPYSVSTASEMYKNRFFFSFQVIF